MIPQKVKRILEEHGLAATEFEPGSTSTSESAADKLGVPVGRIAKSILLAAKDGRFFLVLCAGDKRISSSKLKKLLGVKTRMASAEETRSATGFDPGGVCPFGVEEIDIYIDASLNEYETVYPAAGTDASGVEVTFQKLTEITGNRVCDVTV
jgi:prolyl-tRNA editing enzyme YbaK/EbsC (Cys-tRNA(Pro) deacylase)